MACQIVFENDTEQIGARPGESVFVDRQRAFDTTAENEWSVGGQFARYRTSHHADETFDLPPMLAIPVIQKEPQEIAQALPAGTVIQIFQWQIVEIQLTDESPGRLTFGVRRLRRGRCTNESDAFKRRRISHSQVVDAVARNKPRQIPVGHMCIDRQVANTFRVRSLVLIH